MRKWGFNVAVRRLAPTTVAFVLVTIGTAGAQNYSTADRATLTSYKLTVQSVVRATTAQRSIREAIATDRSIASAMQPIEGENLDQQIKHLDAIPKLKRSISDAGLMPKDFALTTICTMWAYMTAEMKKNGSSSEKISRLPVQSSAQQLEFVEANKADVNKLVEALTGRPARE